ncbi:hypothetical protein [Mucilaginibacter segetis]|uniref:Uncharacterized protein n=1 Tax=Mucilaginibacter segetis TaxID=2793071 RepID=A0A934PRA5_9SPHI|nr:hypothetical protein [Mucilaginibacter segetis]MBK0379324.1 hypothetical protein [Mucilaginibacter segetis]
MAFFRFLWKNSIYLLVNIIILLLGAYLIKSGTCLDVNSSDQSNSTISISIGTSLIAASIVMFLDLFRQLSISRIFAQLQNIVYDAGLQHIYKKRDIDKYDDLVSEMSSSLDIVGYSLGAFFESYSDILQVKTNKNPVNLRIMLVDPDSLFSKNRAQNELKSEGAFREKITTMLRFFKGNSKVEIRFFHSPISSMIFRIDKVMFVGPHFYKKQSKATTTMEIKQGHWLFEEYQQEFERMWADASPVDDTKMGL